jgi:hypothetical protein
LDKEKLLVASQIPLVLVALALQVVGFLLPLYAVIFEDINAGPVVTSYFLAYSYPLNLLPLIALDLAVIFVLRRHIRSAKDKPLVNSPILAYATLLFLIPSWFLVWANMVDYRYFIVTFPEVLHVRLGLMPGFYAYSLGCILLVVAQVLYPVAMRGQKPTSEEALQWAHRHKFGIGAAVLLLAVTPLILIFVPGFPIIWSP